MTVIGKVMVLFVGKLSIGVKDVWIIPLTQGYEAYVDNADYEWIKAIGPWYYHNGYAVRRA